MALQSGANVPAMTIVHYAGLAAAPLLVLGYILVIRWATRPDA